MGRPGGSRGRAGAVLGGVGAGLAVLGAWWGAVAAWPGFAAQFAVSGGGRWWWVSHALISGAGAWFAGETVYQRRIGRRE